MSKGNWAQPRTIREFIQHEYGHAYFDTFSAAQKNTVHNFYLRDLGDKYALLQKQLMKQVSQYAAENPKEMFAEMFVQMVNNRASSLTKELFQKLGISFKGKIKGIIKARPSAAIKIKPFI